MKLQLSHIAKNFGSDEVLQDVSLSVKNTEKIALIGRNGCGKTTVLKMIAGLEDPDKGTITVDPGVKIGYLSQISFPDETRTVWQELLSVFDQTIEMEKKMQEMAEKLEKDHSEQNLKLYDFYQSEFERLGGYDYEAEIKNVFFHFGFGLEDLSKPLSDFSSGQRTRIALVKLLLEKPEILLLDEPTNHLDLDSIEWLENYIKHYPRAVILVCHDRTFIDRVADEIVEIEYGRSERYVGNYDKYLADKKLFLERNEQAYERQQAEMERLQALIDRFKAKASKAAFAKSRQKMLDRMKPIEKRKADDQNMKASFSSYRKGGNDVLLLEDLESGYDSVLSNTSLSVHHGDRIGIVGPNGIGKSTLIKTIARRLKKLSGEIHFGHHIDVGYFDQDVAQQSGSQSILDELWAANPEADQNEIRNVLAAFLFRGEEVFKSLDNLSGGEKVRLTLARLMMDHDNLLLLDEPTNHLDIPSKEALEQALQDYDGTILFVSHDRWFLDKMATTILEVGNPSVYHKDTYKEYLAKKEQPEVVKKVTPSNQTFKNQRATQNRIKKLEELISQKEEALKELDELRFEPEYYSDFEKMEKLEKQIEDTQNELDAYMEEWLEKSASLA